MVSSPAALGYQAARAARSLGIPTVAIYQTDLVGFAERYDVRLSTAQWVLTSTLVCAAATTPALGRWGSGRLRRPVVLGGLVAVLLGTLLSALPLGGYVKFADDADAMSTGPREQIEDPAEAIQRFILNVAHHVELSGFRAGGPITTIALETASTSVRLREECQRIYSGWQTAFADKLVQGGMSRERAHSISILIIASIEGGVILCRTEQSRNPLEKVAEEITMLIRSVA